MADEQTFDPDATSDATLLNGENGDASQTEAEQAQTPPPQNYLSREDFERMRAEDNATWQKRLSEVEQKAQAKADKARDTAIRKAQGLDGYVASLKAGGVELDDAQIATIKSDIINREFWQPEPEPAPVIAPQPTPEPAANAARITERDVIVQLAADDLDVFTLGKDKVAELVKQFQGKPVGDPSVVREWDTVKAQLTQLQNQQRQQQAQAQNAAQNANAYGGTKTIGGGAAVPGGNPVLTIQQMLAQDPPNDPVERAKFNQRLEEAYAEANKREWK